MTIMVAEAGFEPAASRLSSPRELPLLYSAVSPPRCCRTGRHGGKHGFQAFEFQPFVALLNYNYSLCSSGFQGKLMQKFIVFFSLCAPIPFLAHVGCDPAKTAHSHTAKIESSASAHHLRLLCIDSAGYILLPTDAP